VRAISAAAEGLDWVVTADPGSLTDLQPEIERLGLASWVRSSIGYRAVPTQERQHGDFLLFPVDLCTNGKGTNFDAVKDSTTPAQIIERLRALCPDSVLMAVRPIYPGVGMLAEQGYNLQKAELPPKDQDLAMDIDAFQIWDGKMQGLVGQGFLAYQDLISRGHQIAPIAASLSLGTYNEEPGYPRIYIPSKETSPEKLDPQELARNIKEGRVMITNGPYIDLTVNNQPMGTTVTDTDGKVSVKLRVLAPNWANVSSITVNMNGQFVRKFILPAGSVDARAGQVFPDARESKFAEFEVAVTGDAILNVIVDGDPALPQDPVNPFVHTILYSDIPQGQRSLAFSAPVLIDFNGDGVVEPKFDENVSPGEQPGGEFVPPF